MREIASSDAWNLGVEVRQRTFELDDGSTFTTRQIINERWRLPGEPPYREPLPVAPETRQQRRYRQRKGSR